MRYGVALEPFTRTLIDTDAALRALDAFAARSRLPEIVPVWCREWRAEARLFVAIRERGAEPVAYVEAKRPIIDVDALLRFADAVGPAPVRLLQEPELRWGAGWQSWAPATYVAYWDASVGILWGRGSGIRFWWCPSSPRKAKDAGYWPGDADIVGFDRYARDDSASLPPRQFAGPTKQCGEIAPSPVWVGEHGSLAGMQKRAERLKALEKVQGVEVVVVMNLPAARPDGKFDDWRFTPAMDRAFATMGV